MNKQTKLAIFNIVNIVEILIEVALFYLNVPVVPDFVRMLGVAPFVAIRMIVAILITYLVPTIKAKLLNKPVAELIVDCMTVGTLFFTLCNGGYILAQLVN